jgi:threonine dehydrogenase-like Zn-dependent dehydrogenase
MKAIVKAERKPGVTVVDWEQPVSQDDPVIKIEAAAICGTDIHIYDWVGYDFMQVPIVMGHEACGTVVSRGNSSLVPGQKVVIDSVITCGLCHYCRTGFENLCTNRKTLGLNVNGVFAEYVCLPSRSLIPLPETVGFEEGSCLEPLGVALRAIENSRIKPGDSVAIVGPGPLGLLTLMLCKQSGVRSAIVIGTRADTYRLNAAKQWGADRILVAEDGECAAVVREYTGGLGADAVFEWSGSRTGLRMACELARPGGQVISGAIYAADVSIDMTRLVRAEITLSTSRSRVYSTWIRAIHLVSNRVIDINPVITHRFPVADAVKAFATVAEKQALKAVIEFA